jgi:hypothetical protein
VTVKLEQDPSNLSKPVVLRVTQEVPQEVQSWSYALLPTEIDALRKLNVHSDEFQTSLQTLFLEFMKSMFEDSERLRKEEMMTLIKTKSKDQPHLEVQAIVYNNFTRNYQIEIKRTGRCYALKSEMDSSLHKFHYMLRYLRVTKENLQEKLTKVHLMSNKLFAKMNSNLSAEETQKLFYDFVNYNMGDYAYTMGRKNPRRRKSRKPGLASYIGSYTDLVIGHRLKNLGLVKLKIEDFGLVLPQLVESVNMSKVRPYLLTYVVKPDRDHFQVSLGFQMDRVIQLVQKGQQNTEVGPEELFFDNLTIQIIVYSFKLCRNHWIGSVQLSQILSELSPSETNYLLGSIIFLRAPGRIFKLLQTHVQERIPEIYRSRGEQEAEKSLVPAEKLEAKEKGMEALRSNLLKRSTTLNRQVSLLSQADLRQEEDASRLRDPKYTLEGVAPARMKFLGGYKYLEDKSVFYYNFCFRGNQMRVKIMYVGERVIISAFQAGTQQNYKLLVKDLPTVERIVDFAQKSSCGNEQDEFIRTASLLLFDRRKEEKGTIFCVNDMFSRKTSVLVDSSPSHMKYNILTEFSNVYIDNFFVKKTLFFSSITKHLGSNYVTAKLFYSFKLEINQLIVLLIISPSKNRFKVHKLIMNNFDLKTYFNLDLLIYVHDERRLLILLNEVMEKLVTYKDILYTKIVIPTMLVKRAKESKYSCILKNVFDQRTLFQSNTQQKIDPRAKFLEERIMHSEVISKGVKRINNQFWIFIVSKNLINDTYDFTLYNQRSRRLYTASMSLHDTYRMSDQYIYNIFKHSHDEIQQIESVSTSFVSFEEQLAKIHSFQLNSSHKSRLKTQMLGLAQEERGVRQHPHPQEEELRRDQVLDGVGQNVRALQQERKLDALPRHLHLRTEGAGLDLSCQGRRGLFRDEPVLGQHGEHKKQRT